MPIQYKSWIVRQDLRQNIDCLYLFGDNVTGTGFGGQAKEMRGAPNAVGIITKRRPSMDPGAFFTDRDYSYFYRLLLPANVRLRKHLKQGGIVICPTAGVGTDRAELPQRSPKCFGLLRKFFAHHGIYPPDWKDLPR